MGSYKYPREMTWLTGAILFLMVMFMSLTGYLLVFDQRAYWASIVAININGTAPILGPYIAEFLKVGPEFSPEHAVAVLLAAHAGRAGRDHGADRAAPVPRDPPRRHVAAVVEAPGEGG